MKWQNEKRKVDDLIPHETNPRTLSAKQADDLRASLLRFDLAEIPAINTNGKILAGHQRIKMLQKLGRGQEEIDVRVPDRELNADEEKEYLIRSNQNGGDWNFEMLEADFDLGDLTDWGFDDDDFEGMLDDEGTEGLTDEDAAPHVPDEPTAKLGQIWKLGDHRLMCGDSTLKEDVERLMDADTADMVFTDPPYGVDYDGGSKKREKLKDDHVGTDIYEKVIPVLAHFCKGPCYTWYAGTKPNGLYNAVIKYGNIHSIIIWVKNNSTFNMNIHYKQKHEPCLYWKAKGATLKWGGNNTEDTVWELDRESKNDFHPTQKPIALAERAIKNHKATSVLDLFLGSGSTLIACEKAKKRCYGMELDPKYCDVIIKRWEDFTGKKAELIA